MTYLNQVALLGTVSAVSDIRYVHDRVCLNFDLLLATRRWAPKGENAEEKIVVPITLYNDQARQMDNRIRPGRQVLITGELTSRNATSAQGSMYSIMSVRVHTLQFPGE